MFKEEFKNIKETKRDLRKFGVTVGVVLMIISLVLFYFEKPSFPYFFIVGAFLFLTGLLFPSVLKPINKIWMSFAIFLGYFMSRVIIILLYYIVLSPIGLIAKILGKKFLNLTFKENTITYWEKRNSIVEIKTDYERQF